MGWTTPATWTVGQVVGASDLNTQVRDNMNFNFNGKAVFRYAGSGGPVYSTTSTTLVVVDATNLVFTATINTGRVRWGMSGSFYADNDVNRSIAFAVELDGSNQTPTLSGQVTTIARHIGLTDIITGLSAASHTFKLKWSSGLNTVDANTVVWWVEEF